MQILVSVQNVAEAQSALSAGVTLIDLKDPSHGALSALSDNATVQVVQAVQAYQRQFPQLFITMSATVGDQHPGALSLLNMIAFRQRLGIQILKFPRCIWAAATQDWLSAYVAQGTRCVAVFSPDDVLQHDWQADIANCHQRGFAGVMLDTVDKSKPLLETISLAVLSHFVMTAKETALFVGIAGGMQVQNWSHLQQLSPDFVGFRGGLCQLDNRANTLDTSRLVGLSALLSESCKFTDY